MDRAAAWEVRRVSGIVHVDLAQTHDVTDADTDAIVSATEKLLTHDEVRLVRLNGPALTDADPPGGLKHAIQSLDALARRYGKGLVVGPIWGLGPHASRFDRYSLDNLAARRVSTRLLGDSVSSASTTSAVQPSCRRR